MKKKLKVFEAFAGIGAQVSALERLNINYEIVGISDWFIDAIICYNAIHCKKRKRHLPSRNVMLKYLEQFDFSRDSVTPYDIHKLSNEIIEQLYIANKNSKNYGSITRLDPAKLPDIDLLVYSFPCQDLSTGGKCLGMKKGSGTRSGLLWEVERILLGLKRRNNLPEYLLLENVRTLLAPANRKDLDKWLKFLKGLGYQNDEPILVNAMDHGVPQERIRAFIVSHFGKKLNVGRKIKNQSRVYCFENFFRTDYSVSQLKKEADDAQLNPTRSRKKMWEVNGRELNTPVNTITCNMDRSNCAGLFRYKGKLGDSFRRLTIREAFLLMGFTEDEYERTLSLGYSYRKMNKLIGNSIVVNVLVSIFKAMFGDKYDL
ncbi:MAG: DNA cytosine methyltransferase [Phascolarctobacterium sp.]|nr:DNA cytosine methyltransferase [Candidatus Phascolarctobacterium caballi]